MRKCLKHETEMIEIGVGERRRWRCPTCYRERGDRYHQKVKVVEKEFRQHEQMMTSFITDVDMTVYHGDCLDVLRALPDESLDCCVTSPPYWGLRDYGADGQLGLESTPNEYVQNMVAVFREVRRVLAPHGTCWLNLGDAFQDKQLLGAPWQVAFALQGDGWYLRSDIIWSKPNPMPESITDRPTKSHEYVFLLTKRSRYYFDQEAVREAHRSTRWGGPVITQPPTTKYAEATADGFGGAAEALSRPGREWNAYPSGGRNIRSVWEIATQPYPDAHFATFPEELARRCILAGCPERVCRECDRPSERIVERESSWDARREAGATRGNVAFDGNVGAGTQRGVHGDGVSHDLGGSVRDLGWSDCGHDTWRPGVVLDPFAGSGTTLFVARELERHSIGIEISEDYCRLIANRTQQLSLFTKGGES